MKNLIALSLLLAFTALAGCSPEERYAQARYTNSIAANSVDCEFPTPENSQPCPQDDDSGLSVPVDSRGWYSLGRGQK